MPQETLSARHKTLATLIDHIHEETGGPFILQCLIARYQIQGEQAQADGLPLLADACFLLMRELQTFLDHMIVTLSERQPGIEAEDAAQKGTEFHP